MTLFCMLNFVVLSDTKLNVSPPTKHIYYMAVLMFPISKNWEMAGKHSRAAFKAGELRDLDKDFVSWRICSVITILITEPSSTGQF